MSRAQFRLLGPVAGFSDGREIDIGFPKHRFLLAILLAEAGRPVRTGSLIERLWGTDSPPTARNALYTYMAKLRATLSRVGLDVIKQGGGYQLLVDPETVDLHRFRSLIGRARRAESDPEVLDLLTEALGLCGRTPFEGLESPWTEAMRVGLAAEQRWALVRRNEIQLQLGRHGEILAGLSEMSAVAPLDESLAEQMMLALHRSGQRAEALRHYHQMREALADELGIDPGEDLQRTYHHLLRDGGPPPKPAGGDRRVPAQLPHDLPVFVGRQLELARLTALLPGPDPRSRVIRRPGVSVIEGAPGVGKTALAIRFAHQAADFFPDGQLYVDLYGHAAGHSPLRPDEVLSRFLRALGWPADAIADDPDERAADYRTALTGKRMLIVLDNAVSSQQVRPLLPGSPASLVVITSRKRLAGLLAKDHCANLVLGPLPEPDAVELLTRLGPHWVDPEAEAATELARRCGNLPLALVIAAELAITRPEPGPAGLPGLGGLSEFSTTEDDATTVLSSFSWSYRELPPAGARMFRLLALHPTELISTPAAAALAGDSPERAEAWMAELARAHLLDPAGPGRYRLSGLLRSYACECADREPEPLREKVIQRMLSWYQRTAANASDQLQPYGLARPAGPAPGTPAGPALEFTSFKAALAWCRAERATLMAVPQLAASAGLPVIAWQLPALLTYFAFIDGVSKDWRAACSAGLGAARQQGSQPGEAWSMTNLGVHSYQAKAYEEAASYLEGAGRRWHLSGQQREEALGLVALSATYLRLGRPEAAHAGLERASRLATDTQDVWSLALILKVRGFLAQTARRLPEAIERFRTSLTVLRDLDYPFGDAWARHDLGAVYADAGEFADALTNLRLALELRRAIGDERGAAITLRRLGGVFAALGSASEARNSWESALNIFEDLNDTRASAVREQLLSFSG
jgi:DNA-binding SARP family transcriptional activator